MAPSAVPTPNPASSRATSPPPKYEQLATERSVVGINFGNSYSSVAVINKEGLPDCIANEDGDRQIGSAISFANGQIYYGNPAKHQLIRNPDHTVLSFRNTLLKANSGGSSDTSLYTSAPFDTASGTFIIPPPPPPSPSLEPSVPPTPLKTPALSRAASAVPSRAQTPLPSVPTPPTPPVPTPQNLTNIFLKYLVSNATAVLGDEPKTVVLTAKDDWSEDLKNTLKGTLEGFENIYVVKETDAALKAYEEYDKLKKGLERKKDRNVLIADIGAKSLSLSLVQVRDGLYIPKKYYSEEEDEKVGGDHLTIILSTHFRKEFTKQTKVSLPEKKAELNTPELRPWTKLLLACEDTKKSLSVISTASGAAGKQSANCNIESLKDGLDYHGSINKGRWELLTGLWWDGVVNKINNWLGETQTLDELILVGGTASLPSFALRLQSIFPDLIVRSEVDPSEVLAKGAALLARDLVRGSSEESNVLQTVPTLSKPIGLILDQDFVTIADEGTPLPTRRIIQIPLPFSTNVEQDEKSTEQAKVRIQVWEGEWTLEIKKPEPKEKKEREASDDEDEFSEDEEEEERIKKIEKKSNLIDVIFPVKTYKTATETVTVTSSSPLESATSIASAAAASKKKKKKGTTTATESTVNSVTESKQVQKRVAPGNVIVEVIIEKDGNGKVSVKQEGEEGAVVKEF